MAQKAAERMGVKRFHHTLSRYSSLGLDTPCFIYHFEKHKTFGPLTEVVFSILSKRETFGWTSILSLAEYLSQKRIVLDPLAHAETKRLFGTCPGLLLADVDEQIVQEAAELKARYNLKLPDAIQAATALLKETKVFVSNDKRFKKVKEIKTLLFSDFVKPVVHPKK